MSTRATYRIYDNYNRLNVYFYVHYDNYPSGAAFIFQKMLDYMEIEKGSYAEAFFRANNEAHFTKSHYCHGDTDYQYNILKPKGNGYILQAFELDRDWKRYNEEFAQLNRGNTKPKNNVSPTLHMTRKKFFEGSVEDFIKLYGEQRRNTPMTKEYYSDHTELSQEQKQKIVDCLLDYPMGDYGYDWKTSQKMSVRWSKLRKILQFADINKLNWENLYLEEFHFIDGKVNYNVGHSASKDIIAWRMQQLVSKTNN